MNERYLKKQTLEDLEKKMVFLGGPRQVGKTTFSRALFPKSSTLYLNWDIDENRSQILKKEFFIKQNQPELLIFDEIHKFKKWRNYLKGIFDSMASEQSQKLKILVTGSAKLDYYRFGGDSLQGRYHHLRLMPLSFSEIKATSNKDVLDLLNFSGFPEPFFTGKTTFTQRWSLEYSRRLFREDLTTLETISDIGSMELLVNRLPETIGSPISINAIREDLQLAHKTVSKWIQMLERLYLVFRISPFGESLIKAVKKEQKLYFYNWTSAESEAAQFENLVACHLLKHALWNEDVNGIQSEVRYIRFKDRREVDFVYLEKNKPKLFIECKLSDDETNPLLFALQKKFPSARYFQVHLKGKKNIQTTSGIRVCPVSELLRELI